MLHDLIEEVLGGAGRNGTGDDQAVHAGAGVEDVVELLLVLRGKRGTGVEDAVLVLAVVDIGADARHAVNPDRTAQAAEVHGLLDDELAGEAAKETEGDGVDAELLEGERHVETLAVGGIAGGVRTNVLIGNERGAGDRHVNGGIGSQSVKHTAS